MNAFYEHHKNSIQFGYRCFDRLLLNGLIQPFQQPERVIGFFNTYRQLYPVSRDLLRDIAGQFQNWVLTDRNAGALRFWKRRRTGAISSSTHTSARRNRIKSWPLSRDVSRRAS